MLKIQNLRIQLNKPLFGQNCKKYLRFSSGHNIAKTSQPATFINEKCIQWKQSINLSLTQSNHQVLFEIYNLHESGYNPEQLDDVLKGKFIIIGDHQKYCSWQVSTNLNQKIGLLYSNIVFSSIKHSSALFKQEQNSLLTNTLTILSLVANIPSTNQKKGCFVFEIGEEKVKTQSIKSRRGNLIYLNHFEINLPSDAAILNVSFYKVNEGKQQILMGEGKIYLQGLNDCEKIALIKDRMEIGQINIQSRKNKDQKLKKQKNEKILFARNMSHSKSLEFTQLENSFMTERKKSIVNPNKNVVFSKEKRFMSYVDRPSKKVSYLIDRGFEFTQPGSNKNYRGKSIGYGNKSDFTKILKNIPGVGDYKLPSIWDRY